MQPAVLGFGALGIVSLAVLSVAGMLVLVADPRLLMASALVWASIGMTYAAQATLSGAPTSPAILFVAGAPVTILIATARLRRHRLRPS